MDRIGVPPARDDKERLRAAAVAASLSVSPQQRLSLSDSPVLKWADFSPSGEFIKGGVSSLAGDALERFASPRADLDIARMARAALEDCAEPGRLVVAKGLQSFFWCLPLGAPGAVSLKRKAVRYLLVTQPLFTEMIGRINAGRRITAGETRALFQLTAGATLAEAAAVDGVSVETRRAQIKSAAAKLQASGQVDLVRIVMGQLAHLFLITAGLY